MSYNNYIAKTQAGFEKILAGEIEQCGGKVIKLLNRAVAFQGDKKVLYSCNYACRTALHILYPVLEFNFKNKDSFYQRIKNFSWDVFFSHLKTISVDTVMSNTIFSNSHYVSLLCKDAVVDFFRDKYDKRPSVSLNSPDIKIHVLVQNDSCSISLDSSGDSLHKRGYRVQTGSAPLSEVLAAGMILLSGWDRKTDFFDPMCGSGTLLTEAAMIASNIPSGYYRKKFSFTKWNDYDEKLWLYVKQSYDDKITEPECEITGSDSSEEALIIAMKNIRSAKLHKDIILKKYDFNDFPFPEKKGFIITNPPYGERIKPENIVQLYQAIGNVLKNKCSGYQAWIISSAADSLKFVGLKPSVKIPLFNGQLECRFVKFDIFKGSLKDNKSQ